jgi:hypothetical protein
MICLQNYEQTIFTPQLLLAHLQIRYTTLHDKLIVPDNIFSLL